MVCSVPWLASLVGRVGAVELAARDQRPDRRRDMVLVGARADEVQRPAVLTGTRLHQLHDLLFIHSFRDSIQRAHAQRARNLVKQCLDVRRADGPEHLGNVSLGMWNEGHCSSPKS